MSKQRAVYESRRDGNASPPMIALATLAENIRRRRLVYKLTLAELARNVRISVPYLSDIENAHRVPSRAIAERLECELCTPGIVAQARNAVVERWDTR